VGTAGLAFLAIVVMREHVRAGDLYLFPIGVALAMLAVLFVALAAHAGADPHDGRIGRTGINLVVLMWPAMAGLAARGRNGYARFVLILAGAFTFAIGPPVPAPALLVAVLVFSFSFSVVKPPPFDFGFVATLVFFFCPI